MKDGILNSILIAIPFAMIAATVIDSRRPAPVPPIIQAGRVVKTEKMVITTQRLHPNITLAAAAR